MSNKTKTTPADLEVLSNETETPWSKLGLKESQYKLGLDLQKKYPSVPKAAAELKECADKARGLYCNLCVALRGTGLVAADMRTLLFLEGYGKQRVTEIIRLVQSPQELFDQYVSGAKGFKASLVEVRAAEKGEDLSEVELETKETPEEKEAAISDRPDWNAKGKPLGKSLGTNFISALESCFAPNAAKKCGLAQVYSHEMTLSGGVKVTIKIRGTVLE